MRDKRDQASEWKIVKGGGAFTANWLEKVSYPLVGKVKNSKRFNHLMKLTFELERRENDCLIASGKLII